MGEKEKKMLVRIWAGSVLFLPCVYKIQVNMSA